MVKGWDLWTKDLDANPVLRVISYLPGPFNCMRDIYTSLRKLCNFKREEGGGFDRLINQSVSINTALIRTLFCQSMGWVVQKSETTNRLQCCCNGWFRAEGNNYFGLSYLYLLLAVVPLFLQLFPLVKGASNSTVITFKNSPAAGHTEELE